MLSLENVKLSRGGFLLDVDKLSIPDGETVAVMGISGSGKTTLLEVMAGLVSPDEGCVAGPDEISFGYQNPYLQFFTEKVSSEILFSKEKMDKADAEKIVSKALGDFLLPSSYSVKSPYELSGGEARRVLLASISSDERPYLFLDECLSGLDEEGEKALKSLLERRKTEGFTTVFTSHDSDFSALADRLLIMKDGRLLYDGEPRKVLSSTIESDKYGINPTYYASIAENLGLGNILTEEELIDAIVSGKEECHEK